MPDFTESASNEDSADNSEASTADHLAIRNLISHVAQLNDTGDVDDYVQCWTDDVVWEMPGEVRRGRSELRDGVLKRRAKGIVGPGTDSRHIVVNQIVHAEGDDTAISDFCLLFITHISSSPTISAVYQNRDTLRRTAQGWKISHRMISKV